MIPKIIFKQIFPNFYNKIKKFSAGTNFIPISTEGASLIELFLAKNTNIGQARYNKIIKLISTIPITQWKEKLYGQFSRAPKIKIDKNNYFLEKEFSLTIIPDYGSQTKRFKLISDENGEEYTDLINQQTLNYAYNKGAKIFCKVFIHRQTGKKELIFRTSKKKTKTINNWRSFTNGLHKRLIRSFYLK